MYRIMVLSLMFALSASISQAQNHQLRVASFNIRYDNPGDSLDAWKYRRETVAELIQFHDFDIFGAQEVLHHQLEELGESLEGYAYFGVGRDDGKSAGEYSPIFYKEEKIKLLGGGTFWLSENPEAPGRGWDAALPRICSWGKFEERKSGFTFFLFNTHFDHRGVEARKESARLILKKIAEIAGRTPVILTGDFNVDQTSESYQLIHNSGRLADSYEKASLQYGASGTFNGFNIHTSSESRIDHIFLSGDFKVLRHGILPDSYQIGDAASSKTDSGNFPEEVSLYKHQRRLPSDHYPVMVVLSYEP